MRVCRALLEMPSSESWLGRWPVLVLLAATGCGDHQERVRQALLESQPPPVARPVVEAEYRVGCPDVLTVWIDKHPELSGRRTVEANGCIDMGKLGGIRVEGLTVREIEDQLRLSLQSKLAVRVAVAEYRSQQIYLFGQVQGLQRAVAYQGPEPVVDVLRRAGGLSPQATCGSVVVVKCGPDGQPERTVRVDLNAILLGGDASTNVLIGPYDQIHVGSSRRAEFNKCVHPWLRPLGWFVRES